MIWVWIVEMYNKDEKEWLPCKSVSGTRNQARWERDEYKKSNPDDQFRVRKYIREHRTMYGVECLER